MIYIQNIQEQQTIFVPRNGRSASGVLTLKMMNTIERTTIQMQTSNASDSDIFHILHITLPEMVSPGEYEYTLLSQSDILSRGVLMIMDTHSVSEYNKTIEYEQYNAE